MKFSHIERFDIVYDGPALAGHQMDMRDLAPALMSLADLLTTANDEINGDATDFRVRVRGSFKVGSFGVGLEASQHVLARIRDIFSGNAATAVANAWAIMGIIGLAGGGGLIGLLRTLKGRRPFKVEDADPCATVWTSETESIRVEHDVLRLYYNEFVRSSLEKMLSPLGREGIMVFGVVVKGEVVLDVCNHELHVFDASIPVTAGEIVSDTVSKKFLKIETLMYRNCKLWHFNDGKVSFSAWIEDEAFLALIAAGAHCNVGDLLVVDLRTVQRIRDSKLINEWAIVKVHEHRTPLQESPTPDESTVSPDVA